MHINHQTYTTQQTTLQHAPALREKTQINCSLQIPLIYAVCTTQKVVNTFISKPPPSTRPFMMLARQLSRVQISSKCTNVSGVPHSLQQRCQVPPRRQVVPSAALQASHAVQSLPSRSGSSTRRGLLRPAFSASRSRRSLSVSAVALMPNLKDDRIPVTVRVRVGSACSTEWRWRRIICVAALAATPHPHTAQWQCERVCLCRAAGVHAPHVASTSRPTNQHMQQHVAAVPCERLLVCLVCYQQQLCSV